MFEKLELSELQMNPFDEIGQHWLLISAKKEGVVPNTKHIPSNNDLTVPIFLLYLR